MIQPHFLLKLSERAVCSSFESYPSSMVNRHVLWGMSYCWALPMCTAFATVMLNGHKRDNIVGTSIFLRNLSVARLRQFRKHADAAGEVTNPPSILPVAGVDGLYHMRNLQIDNSTIFLSSQAHQFWKTKRKLTVYAKKEPLLGRQ